MLLDLSKAVVLGLVLMGLIAIAKSLYEGTTRDRIVVGIVALVCLLTVVLVAASDFAHETVLLNRPLDSLNFASQLVLVVLLIGVASAAWETLKAVKNIGQNHTSP